MRRGIQVLESAGASVVGCLSVLVYRESVAKTIPADVYALATLSDIFWALKVAKNISEEELAVLSLWLDEPSSWSAVA